MNLSPWRVAWERDDLEGRRRGFDAFPLPSPLLPYPSRSFSLARSPRANVSRAIGEMASRCWTLSGNFRSRRKGS